MLGGDGSPLGPPPGQPLVQKPRGRWVVRRWARRWAVCKSAGGGEDGIIHSAPGGAFTAGFAGVGHIYSRETDYYRDSYHPALTPAVSSYSKTAAGDGEVGPETPRRRPH